MRSYVCTRDIHKWVMFANYIFANITSVAKFAKISSRENFQVHGTHSTNMAASRQFVGNTAQYFRPKPPSLKIREEICRGAYGSVHFGELDGRPVAVKRIHRLLLEAARGQGDFERVMTDFQARMPTPGKDRSPSRGEIPRGVLR